MGRALRNTFAKALVLTFRRRQHHHIHDRQVRAALAPKPPLPYFLFLRTRRLRYTSAEPAGAAT